MMWNFSKKHDPFTKKKNKQKQKQEKHNYKSNMKKEKDKTIYLERMLYNYIYLYLFSAWLYIFTSIVSCNITDNAKSLEQNEYLYSW
jgi:hypothetical protein